MVALSNWQGGVLASEDCYCVVAQLVERVGLISRAQDPDQP